MKKIQYILFAIAFFALVPSMNVRAQKETTYSNGLGYSKNISTPDDEGIYTITLEAFTTGNVTVTKKSIPADIVLVLDISGSMSDYMTYTARTSQSYTYNNYPSNANSRYYYLHSDGQYYQVQRWRQYNTGNDRRLRFQVGDTWWYLSGTSATTTMPAGTGGNTTIWTGVLYEGADTRLDILKTSVNNFIDIINDNDLYFVDADGKPDKTKPRDQRLGNRIAIVTYSTNANNATNGLLGLGGGTNDNNGLTSLHATVNGLTAGGGTYPHRGMQQAYGILSPLNDTRQLRTTVFFTDGVPGLYGNWTSTTTFSGGAWGNNVAYREDAFRTANATIYYANQIKNLANDSKGISSSVYSVSVINNPSVETQVYLGKTSSNWLGANNMGWYTDNWNTLANSWNYNHAVYLENTQGQITGTVGARNTDGTNYSFESTSAEGLNDIFETIASSSGGSDADLGGSTVAVMDIVSANFMLPNGADPDQITVYTAACTGGTEGALTFGDPIPAKDNDARYHKITRNPDGTIEWSDEDYDVDEDIEVTIEGTNMIQVTGFDYASNFCGFENGVARGYKVLIEIPVKMDPEAVGGANSDSNEAGSGIYADLDGDGSLDPIVTYTPPKVDLPTNIYIEKEGLKKGESAKFRIERVDKNASEEVKSNPDSPEWEPVTTVFLTNTVGEGHKPMVKVRGLDPNYIYQIVEEPWSWAYTSEAITVTRTDLLITNPFKFKNTPKEGIDKAIRHAESKATNDFIGSGSATYVDSKENVRE